MPHFAFFHAARRQGRRANADAARFHGWVSVERNGVLVDGDARLVQRFLRLASQHAFGKDIDQHEMRVGAAGNDAEAFRRQRISQYFRVGHDLPGVIAEIGLHGFAEAHRLGGDNVHEWPTLHAGENDFIDSGCKSCLHRIIPARGPRSVLCVVEVTMCA